MRVLDRVVEVQLVADVVVIASRLEGEEGQAKGIWVEVGEDIVWSTAGRGAV